MKKLILLITLSLVTLGCENKTTYRKPPTCEKIYRSNGSNVPFSGIRMEGASKPKPVMWRKCPRYEAYVQIITKLDNEDLESFRSRIARIARNIRFRRNLFVVYGVVNKGKIVSVSIKYCIYSNSFYYTTPCHNS